jgi:hypothetical protein
VWWIPHNKFQGPPETRIRKPIRRTDLNTGLPIPICICLPSELESHYPLGAPYENDAQNRTDILRVNDAASVPQALAASVTRCRAGS